MLLGRVMLNELPAQFICSGLHVRLHQPNNHLAMDVVVGILKYPPSARVA